jgi:hypothetical protein
MCYVPVVVVRAASYPKANQLSLEAECHYVVIVVSRNTHSIIVVVEAIKAFLLFCSALLPHYIAKNFRCPSRAAEHVAFSLPLYWL